MTNTKPVVLNVRPTEADLVQTRTGRKGYVRGTNTQGVAYVQWEDGEEFPIKLCHLQVLARNCQPFFTRPKRSARS